MPAIKVTIKEIIESNLTPPVKEYNRVENSIRILADEIDALKNRYESVAMQHQTAIDALAVSPKFRELFENRTEKKEIVLNQTLFSMYKDKFEKVRSAVRTTDGKDSGQTNQYYFEGIPVRILNESK